MEADKQHSEEKQQSQFNQDELGDDKFDFSKFSSENDINVEEELHKIHEKMDKQSAEFRAEIEAVKNQNKLLLEKNSTLVAKMDALQARNDGLLDKLKVAELEARLANEQLAKVCGEQTVQLTEKLDKAEKRIEQLELALTNKMEGNGNNSQKQSSDSEVRQMQEEMTSLRGENNHFRAEVGTLKTEKQLLDSKVEAIQAKMGKEIDKLMEEQRKSMEDMQQKFAEQLESMMDSKMAEVNDKLKKQFHEAKQEGQQEFSEQMAGHEKNVKAELQKMAKKLDDNSKELRDSLIQGIADLGVKFGNLEYETVDGQCKLEEMRKTVDALMNLTKLEWNNNKWHISNQNAVQANSDELTMAKTIRNDQWTNVRAARSVSRAMLALIPGQKLVYWEMAMKKECAICIGWVGPNVPLNNDKWIGDLPGSFSISCVGNYRESGSKVEGHGKGFGVGDVVGSGLLLTRDHRLKMFFTKNGALNGKPIVLKDSQDLQLYPAVSFLYMYTSVEANFGTDLAEKPFMFKINAHETHLFG